MINTIKKIEKIYSQITKDKFTFKVEFNNNEILFVPVETANTDYQAIQEWIAKGGEVIDNPPTQENI